jgi:hypothetical protein
LIIHDKNWCCFYFRIFVHELISSSQSESYCYPLYCSFNGELRHYWQWFWYTIQRWRYVFLSYSIVFKYFKMHQPSNISNIPFIVYHWTCLNVWYIVYTWRNSNNVRQMSGFSEEYYSYIIYYGVSLLSRNTMYLTSCIQYSSP